MEPREEKLALGTLLFASSLTIMIGAPISPALPPMTEALAPGGQGALWIKVSLTAPSLAIALLAAASGHWGDRQDRRKLLGWAAVAYAAAGTMGLYVQELWQMIASRLVLGAATALTMTMATSLIGDYFDGENRKRLIGLQGAAMSVAAVFYLLVGGLLAEWTWRAPFGTYFLALLAAFGAWRLLPKPPAQHAEDPLSGKGKPPWRLLVPVYVVGLLTMLSFYIVAINLPFFMENNMLGGAAWTGAALAAANVVAAVVAYKYARLHSRLSYPMLGGITFLSLGLGYAIIYFSHSLWTVFVAMLVAGFGIGLLNPNANNWVLSITDGESRARSVGGLVGAMYFGFFLSPFVSEAITGPADPRALFGLASIVLITLGVATPLVFHFVFPLAAKPG